MNANTECTLEVSWLVYLSFLCQQPWTRFGHFWKQTFSAISMIILSHVLLYVFKCNTSPQYWRLSVYIKKKLFLWIKVLIFESFFDYPKQFRQQNRGTLLLNIKYKVLPIMFTTVQTLWSPSVKQLHVNSLRTLDNEQIDWTSHTRPTGSTVLWHQAAWKTPSTVIHWYCLLLSWNKSTISILKSVSGSYT